MGVTTDSPQLMDDYAIGKAQKFADEMDVELEEAKSALEDKMQTVQDRAMEDLSEKEQADYAFAMLSADEIRESRVGVSGTPMELQILTIGQRGTHDNHRHFDDTIVTSHAMIRGELDGDGKVKARPAILFTEESDVPTRETQNKFMPLNTLRATYEVEECWEADGMYRCYSNDDTELVEEEFDELPDSRDGKNELLRKVFDDVELASLAEDGKGLSAFDSEEGWLYDDGVDVKRFRGNVVSWYLNDSRTYGNYVMLDESVLPEDEFKLEDTPIVGDRQKVPGLQVKSFNPDWHINYGEGSVLDVYGVIQTNDDGQIEMEAVGVVPIVPTDMEMGDGQSDGVQATEESI